MPINITTAIDSLVEFVKTKKRVTLEEASSELGIPLNIIDEWANFLEEEGVISREYKFTTPFLLFKEEEASIEDEEELKRRLDLATRHLEFMISNLKKYIINAKVNVKNIEDVRSLIKSDSKKITKEFVYAQKFILGYQINELLNMIKKIKLLTPELMQYIEKKIVDIDNRRDIFEKNYNTI